MLITRDVKDAPPYWYTFLVVCRGNISSSTAWQKRVWAQLWWLGPHPLHRGLSSLPAGWGCQEKLEPLEESSGGRVRMELDKTQFPCCPDSGYMLVLSMAVHCTAQNSPHPSLQRPTLLLYECCLESIREKVSTPNIMWENPLVWVVPLRQTGPDFLPFSDSIYNTVCHGGHCFTTESIINWTRNKSPV